MSNKEIKNKLSHEAVILANIFATLIAGFMSYKVRDLDFFMTSEISTNGALWCWDINEVITELNCVDVERVERWQYSNADYDDARRFILRDIPNIGICTSVDFHDLGIVINNYADLMQELYEYKFWLLPENVWKNIKSIHKIPYKKHES